MSIESANHPVPLGLEDYAAVSAQLLQAAGTPADVVLAQLGIPVDVWRASAKAWERALDEELARGGNTLLTTFAARFVATRAAIGQRTAPPPPAEPAPPTRREPAVSRSSIPAAPDPPIALQTALGDRRLLARPAVPLAPSPAPPARRKPRRIPRS